MSTTPEPDATEQILARLARVEERLSELSRDVEQLRSGTPPAPASRVRPRVNPPPLPITYDMNSPTVAPPPLAVEARPSVGVVPPFASIHKLPSLPAARKPEWEAMIGKRWASWVGGLLLLFGVCFFLKYAWNQGWIQPSPQMRVIVAIALGVALGALGEWVYQKQMTGLAAVLYGSGIAIVMASLFAAHTYFDPPVLSRAAAFVGVAIVSLAGLLLAVRVNLLSLAVIALVGAYVSPAILHSGEDKSVALLTYVGLVTTVGLCIAHLKRIPAPEEVHADRRWFTYYRWGALRWLVLASTALWFFAWWYGLGQLKGHWTLALIWAGIVYAFILLESFVAVQRTIARSAPAAEEGAGLPIASSANTPLWMVSFDKDLAAFALVATAWAFLCIYVTLEPFGQATPGRLALALAAAQSAVALLTVSRRFMYSAILQAAALVTLAAPLLLDQFSVTLAWLALAVALAALAWLLNLKSARPWAIGLLLLSACRLFLIDRPTLLTTMFLIGDQPLSRWLLMMWGTALLFHLVAWAKPTVVHWGTAAQWVTDVRERKVWVAGAPGGATNVTSHPTSSVLSYATPLQHAGPGAAAIDVVGFVVAAMGTVLFALATLDQWSGPAVTLAGLVWLFGLVLLADLGRHLLYGPHALILAVILSIRWLLHDEFGPLLNAWTEPALDTSRPFLNLMTLAGLLLCAAVVLLGRKPARSRTPLTKAETWSGPDNMPLPSAAVVWTALLLFALLNFESWRVVDFVSNHRPGGLDEPGIVKQMAMSVLWSLLGFAGVVIGFARKIAPMRYASLLLLAATLAKIVLIDMSNVEAVWRILSFIALGALLLGVSYVYHRHVESKVQAPDSVPGAPPAP